MPEKQKGQKSAKPPTRTSLEKSAASKPDKPSPKCNENQMTMKETPEGFKMTKEALYCFIHLMWGMVEVGAVPPPPDLNNIREFTSTFSNNDQINNVFESSMA
ncbi:hypothetical protein CROQUDRAFT_295536 [Cronartium quercuum f. sp. fusiforme G11]|uniref:Uncharacterized protein n=1 Tax=Cronartium quercuum f. sp. fusiforme G11 TaxID=708437 RepID=A0A9P6NBT2_9BASI|nr:hypothetical protein CROQUDRAFT_295536 [Cronartium quercuum f. sp. fusiforme G11]